MILLRFDHDEANFFTSSTKSRIVRFILDCQKFCSNSDSLFGIERLLEDKTYIAAYPLHDGNVSTEGSMRNLLHSKWASMKACQYFSRLNLRFSDFTYLQKWYQYQPLDYIKDYFGVKIGIYFAWLGFYTNMLVIASVAGLISFFFSLKSMIDNSISDQICNNNTIIMCPLCDRKFDSLFYSVDVTC
jgi:anoctamin-1